MRFFKKNTNQTDFVKKLFATSIVAITCITLLTRVLLRIDMGENLITAIVFLTQFFTILTNILVLLVMARIAVGRKVPAQLMFCIVISIACVGLIYHLLLAHLNPLQGLALAADHGVHTVVPLLTVVWWLIWGEKPSLRWSDTLLWIIWPLLYCFYALGRATNSGFYPYPFIDLSNLGPMRLAANLAAMAIVFIIIGLLLSGVGKLILGKQKRA